MNLIKIVKLSIQLQQYIILSFSEKKRNEIIEDENWKKN